VSIFLVDAGREWRENQRQMLAIARELPKMGYAAHLVLDPAGEAFRRAAAEDLPALPVRMQGRMGWLLRRNLVRLMRDYHCKLAHFFDTASATAGLAAAAAAQVPLRILSRPADSSPLEGRLPFPSIDAIIAGTEAVKGILVQGGVAAAAVEVIPPGVDFSRFTSQPPDGLVRTALGLDPDDFLIGAVLALEDERGQQAFLEAADIVRAQAPKVKIVVLGQGSLRLEAGEGAEVPAMDNVRYFLGFSEETPRALASLDMFVLFSHLDGFGGALIEAMASGLPVAAVDVGTARNLVIHRESGMLVQARNAKALADAMLKVHFDRNLALRLGAKGRETVLERYSAEAMARRAIAVYEYRAHRKGLKLA
jgi:glycosyltransferase involved in cell wall biosynthesis